MLVAGAASGLGLYHERLGVPCDELRLSTPTSQRRGHEVGGNWFAPARVAVPTAAGPRRPHFEVVADRLTHARVEPALRFAADTGVDDQSPPRASAHSGVAARKRAPSTSSQPRSPASAGRVASAVLASRPVIRSGLGWVAR